MARPSPAGAASRSCCSTKPAVYGFMSMSAGKSQWSLILNLRIRSKSNSKRFRCRMSTGGSECTQHRLTASTYSPSSHLYLLSPSSTSPSKKSASESSTERFDLQSSEIVNHVSSRSE